MKKLQKLIALILVLFSLLFLFSCNKDKKKQGHRPGIFEKQREIRLPYSKQDGLNPYFAKSRVNYNLFPLLYESLVTLDQNFATKNVVATNIENKGSFLDVTVDKKKFSPNDVVYSFNMAKASPLYAPMLANVDKATINGNDKVRFSLKSPMQFAAKTLTFPIVKSRTADKKDMVPQATGMYVISGETLEKNKKSNVKPTTEKIALYNINEDPALYYAMQVGNIDAYYDPLTKENLKASPTQRAAVSTSNLVCLMIGPNLTINAAQKKYISANIDREKFKNEGYAGHLLANNLPYPKGMPETQKFYVKDVNSNELKEQLGDFTKKQYSLIYCKDNNIKTNSGNVIASQLNNAGIKIKAEALTYDEYMSRIKSGRYDFALAEIKLTEDMNLTPVITNKNFKNIYDSFENGTLPVEQYIKSYYDDPPFIALGHKTGVLVYSRLIKENVSACDVNVYGNFQNWHIKETN